MSQLHEHFDEYTIFAAYSELPAFLTKNGGLNSGFMMAQCTAAALGQLCI